MDFKKIFNEIIKKQGSPDIQLVEGSFTADGKSYDMIVLRLWFAAILPTDANIFSSQAYDADLPENSIRSIMPPTGVDEPSEGNVQMAPREISDQIWVIENKQIPMLKSVEDWPDCGINKEALTWTGKGVHIWQRIRSDGKQGRLYLYQDGRLVGITGPVIKNERR
jgi:hypothetical protein